MDKICSFSLEENQNYLEDKMNISKNYDILYHTIEISGRKASYYFIDGFCKDDIMQKLTQYFMDMTCEIPQNTDEFLKNELPYTEIGKEKEWDKIITQILSGVVALFIDGYDSCIMIDARTYPARDVSQPDKEKTLRGSKDSFVETIVFNNALIRRRIRDVSLVIEMKQVGSISKTDVSICYMKNKVNQYLLRKIEKKIDNIKVEALTVNQESLAECLYKRKWYNPFPKFRYTERPDVACAQLMEGNIVVFTDLSPFAMIIPTALLDIMEEADDYYFPPITGTYLRFTRFLIAVLSYFITPAYLLFMMNPEWIPASFEFVKVKETINVPLVWQFLILELAIDGLRLAAVNTPNMLSTPLSIMAGLVLGEFSVKSGWFNAEVMLYMAFVAIANYTHTNYEFGYAIKFMRILTLLLTYILGVTGFVLGLLFFVFALICNRTSSGRAYLYPIIPFNGKELYRRLLRKQL